MNTTEEQKFTEKELSDFLEYKMPKKEGIIYDATREQLVSNLEQLQRLQDEGVNVGRLPEKVWGDIVDLIESRDEERLEELRKELHNKIVMDEWQKEKYEP